MKLRPLPLCLLLLALLGAAPVLDAAPDAAPARVIYLQPLGEALPAEDVALVVTSLRAFYGLEVRTLPRRPLPQAAYHAPRSRYRAERILEHLAPLLPADGVRILGLTEHDISTTKGKVYDWGVLGLASLDGKAGVISSFRCHKKARDRAHARERLAKVAVHEIGHTQGLDHCPTRGCLMEDAGGQVASTDREYDLCPRCRQRLTALGRAAPPRPLIPWLAPP